MSRKLATDDIEMDTEEERLADTSHHVKDPWWETSDQWMSKYSKVAWIVSVTLSLTTFVLLCLVFYFANKSQDAENAATARSTPKNIIFMLSDGFGPASVTLARVFKNYKNITVDSTSYSASVASGAGPSGSPGAAGERGAAMEPLNLDTIHAGHSRTYSSSSYVTDSAAGATAISCGVKTINLQVATDNKGKACATLMEAAKNLGMKTGIAVTSSVTDASPASFSSHSIYRNCHLHISKQQADSGLVDVMFGGGRKYYSEQHLQTKMQQAGYSYCEDVTCMSRLKSLPALGLFDQGHMSWEIDRDPAVQPSLTEMATKAVELLNKDNPNGFFLFIEGSKIDKAAHPNDVATHLREILEYDNAIGAMKRWAEADGQTLVVSTSDHETGGVTLGRGTLYNPGGNSEAVEATLRTESFLNPSDANCFVSGVSSAGPCFRYQYLWYPENLASVGKSAEMMKEDAALAANIDWTTVATDDGARAQLVQQVVEQVRQHANVEMTADEKAVIDLAAKNTGSTAYSVQKAIGSIFSRRANVGWTTWGHTGVDVNLYSYGPGSDQIRGSLENSQIGQRLSQMMGVDLVEETKRMAPKFDQIDLSQTVRPHSGKC